MVGRARRQQRSAQGAGEGRVGSGCHSGPPLIQILSLVPCHFAPRASPCAESLAVPSSARVSALPLSDVAEWRPDGAFAAAAVEALQASPAVSAIADREVRSALQLSLQQMVSRVMGHADRRMHCASMRRINSIRSIFSFVYAHGNVLCLDSLRRCSFPHCGSLCAWSWVWRRVPSAERPPPSRCPRFCTCWTRWRGGAGRAAAGAVVAAPAARRPKIHFPDRTP